MSFFKKYFGGDGNKQNEDRPDISALLSSSDTNSAIIEIDNYVSKICSWGDDLGQLNEPQKHFYFNQNLEREVNNGGFNQYFFNSSGDFAHETLLSLLAIGANHTASILQQAINQFPNSVVPNNQDERREVIAMIEEAASEIWEQLDQAFFKYEDNLNDLNIAYIKQNRISF